MLFLKRVTFKTLNRSLSSDHNMLFCRDPLSHLAIDVVYVTINRMYRSITIF